MPKALSRGTRQTKPNHTGMFKWHFYTAPSQHLPHFCTKSVKKAGSTEPSRKPGSPVVGLHQDKEVWFSILPRGFELCRALANPAIPATSDKGILKAHASSASDPSLPTALKCSENINTSSVQAVPGTRCPATLSLMASTREVPWSLRNLLLTNPTQAPKAHPGWGPEVVANASYALFISTWFKKYKVTPSGTKRRTETLAVSDGPLHKARAYPMCCRNCLDCWGEAMANRNTQNSREISMQFPSQKADTTDISKFHSSSFLSNETPSKKTGKSGGNGRKFLGASKFSFNWWRALPHLWCRWHFLWPLSHVLLWRPPWTSAPQVSLIIPWRTQNQQWLSLSSQE